MTSPRAWLLLASGRRLDLLNPEPNSWTDADLAIGLSRTYRWGGMSAWDLPLSVAQHSLTVLAIRRQLTSEPLTPSEALRELIHDAEEALLGGWDPIAPLKPHLGSGFKAITDRLRAAIDQRYQLAAWNARSYALHKEADHLAAASEAYHVTGWSKEAIRESLGITLTPLDKDPLVPPDGLRPWQPWPAPLAAAMFLRTLQDLRHHADAFAPDAEAVS